MSDALAPCVVGRLAARGGHAGDDALVPIACSSGRTCLLVGVPVPDDRAVDVRARQRLATGVTAEREPGERRGRLAQLGDRQLDQAARERVEHDRVDRGDAGGGEPGLVQRDDHRMDLRGGVGETLDPVARGDQPAHVERVARLDGDQVEVLDDADQFAARRDHREVADPAVEHLEQHAAAEAVRRDGVGGRRHHDADRIIHGDALGDHARAQVTVGDDAERARAVELDHHRARARLGHQPRRVLIVRLPAATTTGAPRIRARTGRCAGVSVPPQAPALGRALAIDVRRCEQRASAGRRRLRTRQHRQRDVDPDPVAERVLVCARREPGREP